MATTAELNACWKDVLTCRPEGSFLFPEHVVVEELLEHIENTWTSKWEGSSRLSPSSSDRSGGSTSDKSEPTNRVIKKKNSWVQRTVSIMKSWRTNPKTKAPAATVERYPSLIPRYPSWADWGAEDSSNVART